MDSGLIFIAVSGLWALAMIFNLIDAIRICYRIEARSGIGAKARTGLPGYANIFGVAFNRGVAQDDETQAMRSKMNRRLFIILGGFVFFYLWITLSGIRG